MKQAERRQCKGKQKFETKADAIAAAIRLRYRTGGLRRDTNAYKCPWCKSWHFGHRPRR